jgi:hypothetical protein
MWAAGAALVAHKVQRGSSGIGAGGAYGGGTATDGGAGATGAVRIIWGAGRAFPSTNTGNV